MENNGRGLAWVLFLIFLALKLTNNIDWPWWWVFSPLWIPLGLLVIVGAILGVVKLAKK